MPMMKKAYNYRYHSYYISFIAIHKEPMPVPEDPNAFRRINIYGNAMYYTDRKLGTEDEIENMKKSVMEQLKKDMKSFEIDSMFITGIHTMADATSVCATPPDPKITLFM